LGSIPQWGSRPDWQALYDEAVDKLEYLYQSIGQGFADDE
jgi:hypothetical protein